MKIQSKRFGPQEIDENQIIEFSEGIIGFKQFKQYVILPEPNFDIFVWLQSLQNPQLAFVLMNPLLIRPDYTLRLTPNEQKELAKFGGAGRDLCDCNDSAEF